MPNKKLFHNSFYCSKFGKIQDMPKEKTIFYYIAWVQALVATLGSLFFSEVMKFTPCKLCWFQRIFMYPLIFIIAAGIIRKDKKLYQYVLPLSVIGWIISLYHNLIYYHVISEAIVPCSIDVPCTTKFFAWFGFITIPLLSFTAFSVITICMIIAKRYYKNE